MNRLRIIIAFMFLLLTGNTMMALNDSKEVFLDIKHSINRPRMPMRYQLVCIYDNGHWEFVLPPDINSINVVVENDSGIIWEGTIDRENLSADIPVLTL